MSCQNVKSQYSLRPRNSKNYDQVLHTYVYISLIHKDRHTLGPDSKENQRITTPLRIESDHEYNIMMLGNIQEGGSQGKGANGGGDGQD